MNTLCKAILVYAFVGTLTATRAVGVDYPDRPVRVIVSSAPGGGPDVAARIVVAELTRQMGKQFVVDNRPGASGVIGTEMVARAASDGYTIGEGRTATLAINRLLLTRLPYDPDSEIQPVAQYSVVPHLLAVALSLPVKSVEELTAYARKTPGKLLFVSTGNASPLYLAGELFKHLTGTRMTHVSYKGTQQGITEMITGEVHVIFDNVASIGPHVRAGRVRGLAMTTAKRSPAFPELPTVAESGVPNFEMIGWAGIVAPAAVSKTIVNRLNAEVNKAVATSTVKEKFAMIGLVPTSGTPEMFAALIRRDIVKWADVIKHANIKPD